MLAARIALQRVFLEFLGQDLHRVGIAILQLRGLVRQRSDFAFQTAQLPNATTHLVLGLAQFIHRHIQQTLGLHHLPHQGTQAQESLFPLFRHAAPPSFALSCWFILSSTALTMRSTSAWTRALLSWDSVSWA